MKTIAEKLKELRGIETQKSVAKELGISFYTLRAYENGSRVPKDEIKIRIAKYYGKSVEEIFYS